MESTFRQEFKSQRWDRDREISLVRWRQLVCLISVFMLLLSSLLLQVATNMGRTKVRDDD